MPDTGDPYTEREAQPAVSDYVPYNPIYEKSDDGGTSTQHWARSHSVSSTEPLCVNGAPGYSKPLPPLP